MNAFPPHEVLVMDLKPGDVISEPYFRKIAKPNPSIDFGIDGCFSCKEPQNDSLGCTFVVLDNNFTKDGIQWGGITLMSLNDDCTKPENPLIISAYIGKETGKVNVPRDMPVLKIGKIKFGVDLTRLSAEQTGRLVNETQRRNPKALTLG